MVATTRTLMIPWEERRDLRTGIRNVRALRRDPLSFLHHARRPDRDVVRMRLGPMVYHLVLHPELVDEVLVKHSGRYGKQARGLMALRRVLGNGLVTSEGEFWRRQRRIAQPAFHRQRVESFSEVMVDLAEDLIRHWQPGEVRDVAADMMAVTLRIIGRTMLSTDVASAASVVAGAMHEVLSYTNEAASNPFLFPAIPTPRNLRFRRALAQLDSVIEPIIAARRAMQDRPEDLLTMFLEMQDAETGESMTDQQLRDEVMTMFLAGHETTANALSWTFLLLSQHPEVARRLRQEIHSVVASAPRVQREHLTHMPYLRAVLQEAMRLYPPVWLLARSVEQAHTLGEYELRPGMLVFLSPYLLHRDPRWWPNPEGFDPERFMEGAPPRPKLAYFPFGAGPRLCIGRGFALQEAQLILATILRRWELALVPDQIVEPEPMITLRPKYGLKMQLTAHPPLG